MGGRQGRLFGCRDRVDHCRSARIRENRRARETNRQRRRNSRQCDQTNYGHSGRLAHCTLPSLGERVVGIFDKHPGLPPNFRRVISFRPPIVLAQL
jgi:hypothetical protein